MSYPSLKTLTFFSLSSILLCSAGIACDSGSSGDESKTENTGDKTSDGSNDSQDTSDSTTTSTTSENTDNTDSTATTDTTNTSDKKANTERCQENAECQSDFCHPVFGICGDCGSDAQCAADGKLNCAYDSERGTKCSDGALGETCEANEGCADGKCHLVQGQGDTTYGICSECVDSKQCVDEGTGVNCATTQGKDWYVCTAGELGDSCVNDDECKDKICHASFGPGSSEGVCSSCRDDKSCQDDSKGLNCTPNSLAKDDFDPEKEAEFFVCSEGKKGETCEAETSCIEELACAISEGQDIGFCAQCATTADCMGDNQVCSLVLDENWQGEQSCVEVGTQAADTICTPQDDPTADACEKICVKVDTMFGDLGICGECRVDHAEEDCGSGKTCEAPVFGQELKGSVCK